MSHFAEALGQTAVEAGLAVSWFTVEDLGALVRRHRSDDSIAPALEKIICSDLITIDDIGLLSLSPDAAPRPSTGRSPSKPCAQRGS
ncbi:ATP-binding protein [Streptomyces roseifaciens]